MSTQRLKGGELEQALRNFTGSLTRYRHWLSQKIIYSEGVKFLAEEAGAWWLIDAIVSHLLSPKMLRACDDDIRLRDMQFWRLEVQNNSARLYCEADCDEEPAITQNIEYTDFPMDKVTIYVGLNELGGWTLYLPSEH